MFPSRPAALAVFALATLALSSFAQQPATNSGTPAIPAQIEPAINLLKASYPKVEAKRNPKAPADSVWLLRAQAAAAGTVEVGFQGADIVYMVFRRGTGGVSFKRQEIDQIHRHYSKELLKEAYYKKSYDNTVLAQINAAVIVRNDFDARVLLSSQ
jgi:hypothetical protein